MSINNKSVHRTISGIRENIGYHDGMHGTGLTGNSGGEFVGWGAVYNAGGWVVIRHKACESGNMTTQLVGS